MNEFPIHSPFCEPGCISGEQLHAALEILGLWFDGQILSVKLGGREGVLMPGCNSSWYAEAEVASPGTEEDPRYRTTVYRLPVHVGRDLISRWAQEAHHG